MNLIKVCSNGHEFKLQNNKFHCPKCGSRLNIQQKETSKEASNSIDYNIEKFKEGLLSFSDLNDPLPRLSWFNDISGNNNPGSRIGEKWTWEELELLEETFNQFGIADMSTWKEISENIFERSLYAIEHMLRIFLEKNLDEIR